MRREVRGAGPAGGGGLLTPGKAPPKTCGICGTPCREPFRAPPAETAPDLDLRPGEPTRSTLQQWVATCRGCGATAAELPALAPRLRSVVEDPAYRALGGAGAELAFQRQAMLCEPGAERAQALLEAAWALDDQDGDAKPMRQRVMSEWGEPATMQDGLRLVDVCRRTGAMDAARHRAEALLRTAEPGGTDEAVLRYQLGLIAARDEKRHLLSSALRPPARTPHVTHGSGTKRGEKRGLWQRLTGG